MKTGSESRAPILLLKEHFEQASFLMQNVSPVRQLQWVDECPEEGYRAKDLYLWEGKVTACQRLHASVQANETLQGNRNNMEEGSEILVSMTKCTFYEKCETMSPMVV